VAGSRQQCSAVHLFLDALHAGYGVSNLQEVEFSLAGDGLILPQDRDRRIDNPCQPLHLFFYYRLQLLHNHDSCDMLQHAANHLCGHGIGSYAK